MSDYSKYEKYVLDGFFDEELGKALSESYVFPLIRELKYKYNLFVARAVLPHKFLLCHSNGMPVANVYSKTDGGANGDKLVYCFTSPWYLKGRGASKEEKMTFTSVKLSAIMASLSRFEVIPTPEHMRNERQAFPKISNMYDVMRDKLGKSSKSNDLDANELHALLIHVLGENPNGSPYTLDLNKCKNILDKYNEADRLAQFKKEESKRFFRNPFYVVGCDEKGDYLVGKFVIPESEKLSDYKLKAIVVEDFKRVKDITQFEELIPIMTMIKVANEGKSNGKGFLTENSYDENLDVCYWSQSYNSPSGQFDLAWIATPCPQSLT